MLKYVDSTHTYTWKDKVVPSVTQVLSRVAVRSDEGSHWNSISGSEFISDQVASDFGTAFHEVAKYSLQGIDCSYDPILQPWVNGLNKFLDRMDIDPLLDCQQNFCVVEEPLYSEKYGYAGTDDLFLPNNKKRTVPLLIDWKTSTQFQHHWRMQTAAYEQLIREEYGIRKRMDRLCVRIYEDGYEVKNYKKSWATDWNDFLSILNVYKKFSK